MLDPNKIPLSLYVHIPWCVKKCPYCDFNSHEARETIPEDIYVDALINDLNNQLKYINDREVISIFIGGGTPSLFSAEHIKRLLQSIQGRLYVNNDVEITIEANPGTVDVKNFAGFREAGVNRISIGVQSFSDAQLQELGRIHSAQIAKEAITIAKQAGFENINIDLMYALPKQSLVQARDDIQQAIDLQPAHISYYQLTLEPNTYFFKHPPTLPNHQSSWEIQQQGVELLCAHEYRQYEISAYAKSQHACKHNLNYWQFGDYLGIGAGAHQKITLRTENKVLRSERARNPKQYMRQMLNNEHNQNAIPLTTSDLQFEFLLNAFRLKQGFSAAEFESRTGLNFEQLKSTLRPLVNDGLVDLSATQITCTAHGYRFLDEVLHRLLPDAA